MKETVAHSHYGIGGRNCICCGPSPSFRKKHDRTVKRRIKQAVKKQIDKEIQNEA